MNINAKSVLASALLAGLMLIQNAFGAAFLVKDGQPQAEIIISEQPLCMVKLAAEELQAYIKKISGARLAITNQAGISRAAQVRGVERSLVYPGESNEKV